MTIRALALAAVVLGGAIPAAAQDEPAGFRPRRLSVSGGVLMTGGFDVGDLTVSLRRNAPGTPPPFTLLRASSEFDRAVGVDVRAALALGRAFALEAGGTYVTPQLRVVVSQDPELAGGATVTEQVSTYTLDVSAVYLVPRIAIGARLRPYVIGGGGYLRQLHDDRTDVDTGGTVHLGGGVRYWLRGGSAADRSLGARAEVRVVRRSGGIDFEDRSRVYPSFSALAFVGF